MSLATAPADILRPIIFFLDATALGRLFLSCKPLNQAILHRNLVSVWDYPCEGLVVRLPRLVYQLTNLKQVSVFARSLGMLPMVFRRKVELPEGMTQPFAFGTSLVDLKVEFKGAIRSFLLKSSPDASSFAPLTVDYCLAVNKWIDFKQTLPCLESLFIKDETGLRATITTPFDAFVSSLSSLTLNFSRYSPYRIDATGLSVFENLNHLSLVPTDYQTDISQEISHLKRLSFCHLPTNVAMDLSAMGLSLKALSILTVKPEHGKALFQTCESLVASTMYLAPINDPYLYPIHLTNLEAEMIPGFGLEALKLLPKTLQHLRIRSLDRDRIRASHCIYLPVGLKTLHIPLIFSKEADLTPESLIQEINLIVAKDEQEKKDCAVASHHTHHDVASNHGVVSNHDIASHHDANPSNHTHYDADTSIESLSLSIGLKRRWLPPNLESLSHWQLPCFSADWWVPGLLPSSLTKLDARISPEYIYDRIIGRDRDEILRFEQSLSSHSSSSHNPRVSSIHLASDYLSTKPSVDSPSSTKSRTNSTYPTSQRGYDLRKALPHLQGNISVIPVLDNPEDPTPNLPRWTFPLGISSIFFELPYPHTTLAKISILNCRETVLDMKADQWPSRLEYLSVENYIFPSSPSYFKSLPNDLPQLKLQFKTDAGTIQRRKCPVERKGVPSNFIVTLRHLPSSLTHLEIATTYYIHDAIEFVKLLPRTLTALEVPKLLNFDDLVIPHLPPSMALITVKHAQRLSDEGVRLLPDTIERLTLRFNRGITPASLAIFSSSLCELDIPNNINFKNGMRAQVSELLESRNMELVLYTRFLTIY